MQPSLLLALVGFKYDAAEAHKTSSHQYDKLHLLLNLHQVMYYYLKVMNKIWILEN